MTWSDGKGDLWLFGGYGYDGNGNLGLLSDLWVFSPSLGTRWRMDLDRRRHAGGQSGVYGTLGSACRNKRTLDGARRLRDLDRRLTASYGSLVVRRRFRRQLGTSTNFGNSIPG